MVLPKIFMKKVIAPKKGFFVRDFNSDSLGVKYVDLFYAKRGRLGKLLKITAKKRILVPRGMRVIRMENNKPKLAAVTITFTKR